MRNESQQEYELFTMLEGLPRSEVLEAMRNAEEGLRGGVLEESGHEITLHRSRDYPLRAVRRAVERMETDEHGRLRRRRPAPLEWEEGEEALLEASDGEGLEARIDRVHCYEGRSERDYVEIELSSGTVSITTECATVDEATACAEAWRAALGDFNRYMRERRG
jgi:hypothetical protein